ncbi:hypothetical protein CRUP_004677 [Coryphaenoides rupestris]|nr:hypothetical protein CRUP_004677 [Coryphaenoides rupestris]
MEKQDRGHLTEGFALFRPQRSEGAGECARARGERSPRGPINAYTGEERIDGENEMKNSEPDSPFFAHAITVLLASRNGHLERPTVISLRITGLTRVGVVVRIVSSCDRA